MQKRKHAQTCEGNNIRKVAVTFLSGYTQVMCDHPVRRIVETMRSEDLEDRCHRYQTLLEKLSRMQSSGHVREAVLRSNA